MTENKEMQSAISMQALRRLPQYYSYLKLLEAEGIETISAPAIAKRMNLNDVQVRKDLASVSLSGGKPKKGSNVHDLIRDISHFLGYDNVREAVLVGAGHLGSALLSYKGFEEYGMKVVAAFDNDPDCVGMKHFRDMIYPMQKLSNLCTRLNIRIGIITVPKHAAQEVCDALILGGVQAIWNFAPTHLLVPKGIHVQNENMAVSLAVLSQYLIDI